MSNSAGQSIARFGDNIRRFIKLESSAGLILMAATILAMIVKNSPLATVYQSLLLLDGEVRVGSLAVQKPLLLWVNDFWMAIFFFLVGMEIKREWIEGYLSDRSQIVLPAIAALGGIVVPATIYAVFNWGDPVTMRGWAVPTATDIAFALGVLALLGSRVPVGLKVFLMTLAVLDDLAAIILIAIFYTTQLSMGSLLLASVAIAILIILNRAGVTRIAAFVLVGVALWVFVLKSGVHATLAGVVLAMAIPAKGKEPGDTPPLRHLIHALHPWVAFAILPAFAFCNAGIDFGELRWDRLLEGVPIGIACGLFFGKQLGVFTFSWLTIKLGFAKLPAGSTWVQLYGISALCGIGFTMSLFIGSLAFAEGGSGYARADRFAIVAASLLAGVVGYLILRFCRTGPGDGTVSSHGAH
jgi:NhaA family Na+:H+ antiporter